MALQPERRPSDAALDAIVRTIRNVKLLLIGDSGVGKTCLMCRFTRGVFASHITTMGIDYAERPAEIDGEPVRIEIWDTAGQERFRSIATSYMRGAQAVLLVYDVADRKSFNHVAYWMGKYLTREQAVTAGEGKALAERYSLPFFETSAKSGAGVDEPFLWCAKQALLLFSPALSDSDIVDVSAPADESASAQPASTAAPAKQRGCC